MAVPMANDPPFATLKHFAADLGIPSESDLLRIGLIRGFKDRQNPWSHPENVGIQVLSLRRRPGVQLSLPPSWAQNVVQHLHELAGLPRLIFLTQAPHISRV